MKEYADGLLKLKEASYLDDKSREEGQRALESALCELRGAALREQVRHASHEIHQEPHLALPRPAPVACSSCRSDWLVATAAAAHQLHARLQRTSCLPPSAPGQDLVNQLTMHA